VSAALGFALGVGIAILLAIRRERSSHRDGVPAQLPQADAGSYQVVVTKREIPPVA